MNRILKRSNMSALIGKQQSFLPRSHNFLLIFFTPTEYFFDALAFTRVTCINEFFKTRSWRAHKHTGWGGTCLRIKKIYLNEGKKQLFRAFLKPPVSRGFAIGYCLASIPVCIFIIVRCQNPGIVFLSMKPWAPN